MREVPWTREALLHEVAAVLQQECRITRADFRETDRLVEDLGLESMGLMILAIQVENKLQIILDETLSPPRTIGDVIDLIGAQLSGTHDR